MSDNSSVLFEQLPLELNVLIINLLDAYTLLAASATCKRWLNNTKYVVDLDICLCKSRQVDTDLDAATYSPSTEHFAWNVIERALANFLPENLRSLTIKPYLNGENTVTASFVSKLTRLESLTIYDSVLSPAVYQLTQLKHLNIVRRLVWGNRLGKCIANCTNLETLSFRCGRTSYQSYSFEGVKSGALKNCTRLQIYDANSRLIRFDCLGELTQLKQLHLEHAYIDDEMFDHLAKLTNLEVLNLAGLRADVPVNDTLFESMEMPEPLGNPNPIRSLRYLTSLHNLTYLDISGVVKPFIDDFNLFNSEFDVAELVTSHLTKLKTLKIAGTNAS